MAMTELNDNTVVARNPLGTGRTVPGKCVAVALEAMSDGITVAEYRERMADWLKKHPAPHLAFPGGSNAMSLLRFLVDRNQKAVVIDKKPKKGKKAAVKAESKAKPKKAAAKKAKKAPETIETTVE